MCAQFKDVLFLYGVMDHSERSRASELETGTHIGNQHGYGERVARRARVNQSPASEAQIISAGNSDRRERFTNNGLGYITRLNRRAMPFEPPDADPHVRWCGGWGLNSPGYPISSTFYAADSACTSWSSLSPIRSIWISRSKCDCRFSQNCADVPKKRPRRNAVSAVTARLP